MQIILLFIFYLLPKNSRRHFFFCGDRERGEKEEKGKIFSLLCQVSSKLSRIIHALLLHNSCSRQLHRSYEKKLQKKKNRLFISEKRNKKKMLGSISRRRDSSKKWHIFFSLFVLFVFSQTHVLLLLVSRKISFPGRDYFRFSRFFRIGLIVIRKRQKRIGENGSGEKRRRWRRRRKKKVFSISPDGFWESEIYTPG